MKTKKLRYCIDLMSGVIVAGRWSKKKLKTICYESALYVGKYYPKFSNMKVEDYPNVK